MVRWAYLEATDNGWSLSDSDRSRTYPCAGGRAVRVPVPWSGAPNFVAKQISYVVDSGGAATDSMADAVSVHDSKWT